MNVRKFMEKVVNGPWEDECPVDHKENGGFMCQASDKEIFVKVLTKQGFVFQECEHCGKDVCVKDGKMFSLATLL